MSVFNLKSTISREHKLEEDDVLRTKFALKDIGYYNRPDYGMTPYSDERMFDGIKKFQKDKGLQIDGTMYPGRETAAAIGNELARIPSQPGAAQVNIDPGHNISPPKTPDLPPDFSGVGPIKPRPGSGPKSPRNPGQLPGLNPGDLAPGIQLPNKPKFSERPPAIDLKISPSARASNQRTAKALQQTGNLGDLPDFMKTAWEGSETGKAQVADLIAQVAKSDPDQASQLQTAVAAIIPGQEDGILDRAVEKLTGEFGSGAEIKLDSEYNNLTCGQIESRIESHEDRIVTLEEEIEEYAEEVRGMQEGSEKENYIANNITPRHAEVNQLKLDIKALKGQASRQDC